MASRIAADSSMDLPINEDCTRAQILIQQVTVKMEPLGDDDLVWLIQHCVACPRCDYQQEKLTDLVDSEIDDQAAEDKRRDLERN